MEEQPKERRTGGAVLIKKGEAVPANAVPMDDELMMVIQTRRIQNFQPQREMRVYHYGSYLLAAAVGVSGVLLNMQIRRNFRLGGLRRMFTYVPSAVLPALFTSVVHDLGIKRRILLGQESCSTCVSIRSGVYQALLGTCYPIIVSILTCLPTARDYYTLSMPPNSDGKGMLRLLQRVAPKANAVAFLGLSNMFIGMIIARKEMRLFHIYLSHPPSAEVVQMDKEIMKE